MVRRLVAFYLIFLVCPLSSPALADDHGRANRLLVGAVQLIQAAQDEGSPDKRYDLLKQAEDNLTEIVERHPSTDLAVKLITGQSIGTVSLSGVSEMVEELERDRCFSSPDNACLIVQSLQTAGKIEEAYSKASALGWIAATQAEAGDRKGARVTVEAALATAEKIEEASDKARALGGVATAQIMAGDRKGAPDTVKSAVAASEKIDGFSTVMVLVTIVWALVEQE